MRYFTLPVLLMRLNAPPLHGVREWLPTVALELCVTGRIPKIGDSHSVIRRIDVRGAIAMGSFPLLKHWYHANDAVACGSVRAVADLLRGQLGYVRSFSWSAIYVE